MAANKISKVATAAGRLYKLAHHKDKGAADVLLPSVTSVIATIDKSAGLLNWSIKTALNSVRTSFAQKLSDTKSEEGSIPDTPAINSEWLEQCLLKAASAPDNIKQHAADFGSRSHSAIDAIIRGETDVDNYVTPDILPVVEGFKRWYSQSGLRLSPAGDTVVFSRTYGYAGAADAFGITHDRKKLVICDFKTSNSIHDSYALQLAAYTYAVREMIADGDLDMSSFFSDLDVNTVIPSDPEIELKVADVGIGEATPDDGGIPLLSFEDLSAGSLPDAGAGMVAMPAGIPHAFSQPKVRKGPIKRRSVVNPATSHPGSAIVDEDLLMPLSKQFHTLSSGSLACSHFQPATRLHSAASASARALQLPVEAWVVRFDKSTGNAEVKRVSDLAASFDAFKAALLLWHVTAHGNLLQPQ